MIVILDMHATEGNVHVTCNTFPVGALG